VSINYASFADVYAGAQQQVADALTASLPGGINSPIGQEIYGSFPDLGGLFSGTGSGAYSTGGWWGQYGAGLFGSGGWGTIQPVPSNGPGPTNSFPPIGGGTPTPVGDSTGSKPGGGAGTTKPGSTLGGGIPVTPNKPAGSSVDLGGMQWGHLLLIAGALVGAYYVIGHRRKLERFAEGRK
jgi:hypothetical protein